MVSEDDPGQQPERSLLSFSLFKISFHFVLILQQHKNQRNSKKQSISPQGKPSFSSLGDF